MTPRFPRFFWILLITFALFPMLFSWFAQKHLAAQMTVPYQRFLEHLSREEVNTVSIGVRQRMTFTLKGQEFKNQMFITTIPTTGPDGQLYSIGEILAGHPNAKKVSKTEEPPSSFVSFLGGAVLALIAYHFWRKAKDNRKHGDAYRASSSSRGSSAHGKPQQAPKKVTFEDVAGADEAVEELREVVKYLKEPESFSKVGARVSRGVLLMGPPGTGKTLLAKAVAGEADIPFFSMVGSEFVEMFVGVGAARVRKLFTDAKRAGKSIIFIDEIDAIGGKRSAGLGTGGEQEHEQTINQLFAEMDGFEGHEGIVVLAATNRPDILDPALLRSGRFDRKIVVNVPSLPGRIAILQIHAKGKPLAKDADLRKIAERTPGAVGADLENFINEAALLATRRNACEINQKDLELAIDKVLMGPERKGFKLNPEELKVVAYHEGGHVLIAFRQHQADPKNADPPRNVSIIPRGMALGVTVITPEEDRHTYTERYILSKITELFGGRVAEELVFGQRSTGAGDDFNRATEFAERMVLEWGMGSGMPPRTFQRSPSPFLGGNRSVLRSNVSDETASKLESEVAAILNDCYDRTKEILTSDRESLDRIAKTLLERETLSADEINEVLGERERAFYEKLLQGIGSFVGRVVKPFANGRT